MSEVEGQVTTEVEGQPEETKVSPEELMKKLEALESSKERILEESKAYKSKYQALEKEREERERTELEKKGEFETLLQREREEKQKTERMLEDMKVKTVASNTRSILAQSAKDAIDIEDLLSRGNIDLIDINEDTMTPTADSVDKFVNDLRTRKPYLFSKKLPKMEDAHPKGDVPNKKIDPKDAFKRLLQVTQQ